MAASWLASESTARTVSPVTWHSAPKRPQRCRHRRPLPYHFHLAMNAGGEVGHRAHAAQFALVDDGNAIAQRFRIGQNVGGEENRLAFVLELLHEVAHFAAAHGIQA